MGVNQFDKAINYCSDCNNLCQFSCPFLTTTWYQLYAPGEKVTAGEQYNLLDKKFPEFIYACIDCGACKQSCAFGIDPGKILNEMRGDLINQGKIHTTLLNFEHNFYKQHNTLYQGFNPEKNIDRYHLKRFSVESKIVLVPGSDLIYYHPEKIEKLALKIEKYLPYRVSLYLDIISDSLQLYYAGYIDEFLTELKILSRGLKQYQKLITPSLNLYYALKILAPRYNIPFPEIIFITEAISPGSFNIDQTKLKITAVYPLQLIYHASLYSHLNQWLQEITEHLIKLTEYGSPPLPTGNEGILPITHFNIAKSFAFKLFETVSRLKPDLLVVGDEEQCQFLSRINTSDIKMITFLDLLLQ